MSTPDPPQASPRDPSAFAAMLDRIAEVAEERDRLRAERDAILRWAARHAARVEVALEDDGPRIVGYKAPADLGYAWASTPEAAVRKAALGPPAGPRDDDDDNHGEGQPR